MKFRKDTAMIKLGILIMVVGILYGFGIYLTNANIMAHGEILDEDYEKCVNYFFDKDMFVPYQILMYFPEASKGGFSYDSNVESYSYWIEKPESFNAEDGTFLGIGSNSTDRVQWKFDLKYQEVKDRDFTLDVISNGESMMRNDFKSHLQEVCVLLNFNVSVQPEPLSEEDILALAQGISEKQIISVTRVLKSLEAEMTQQGNLFTTVAVFMALAVALLYLNNRNQSRKVRIQEKVLQESVDRSRAETNAKKREKQYYEITRLDEAKLNESLRKEQKNILQRFIDAEAIFQKIHYIYQFIKEHDLDIEDPKPEKDDTHVESHTIIPDEVTIDESLINSKEDVSDSKLQQLTSSITNKIPFIKSKEVEVIKLLDETVKPDYYAEYKEKQKKLSGKALDDWRTKEWTKWYVLKSLTNLESENRLRIDALMKIEGEREE